MKESFTKKELQQVLAEPEKYTKVEILKKYSKADNEANDRWAYVNVLDDIIIAEYGDKIYEEYYDEVSARAQDAIEEKWENDDLDDELSVNPVTLLPGYNNSPVSEEDRAFAKSLIEISAGTEIDE